MGSKYGSDNLPTNGACVENKKSLKKRIKDKKRLLKDFIDISNYVDMDYIARRSAIGSIYMELQDLKRRIKNG